MTEHVDFLTWTPRHETGARLISGTQTLTVLPSRVNKMTCSVSDLRPITTRRTALRPVRPITVIAVRCKNGDSE